MATLDPFLASGASEGPTSPIIKEKMQKYLLKDWDVIILEFVFL